METCHENFLQAVEDGNFKVAKACIVDMFDLSPEKAREMNEGFRLIPIGHWKRPSSYPEI